MKMGELYNIVVLWDRTSNLQSIRFLHLFQGIHVPDCERMFHFRLCFRLTKIITAPIAWKESPVTAINFCISKTIQYHVHNSNSNGMEQFLLPLLLLLLLLFLRLHLFLLLLIIFLWHNRTVRSKAHRCRDFGISFTCNILMLISNYFLDKINQILSYFYRLRPKWLYNERALQTAVLGTYSYTGSVCVSGAKC